jgi:hypothetical protein
MAANSGLAVSAVTVRGSSAMPQIGQLPGPARTICGCMGQVYSAESGRDGGAGPMDTRGTACEPSYLPGSASNFVLQPWLQKYQVRPACWTEAAAFSGSTFIPHTGSISVTAASAAFSTCNSFRKWLECPPASDDSGRRKPTISLTTAARYPAGSTCARSGSVPMPRRPRRGIHAKSRPPPSHPVLFPPR